MQAPSIWLSLDPGVVLGFAVWEEGPLVEWGELRLGKGLTGTARLLHIKGALETIAKGRHVIDAIIERPHVWTPRNHMNAMITSTQFQAVTLYEALHANWPIREITRNARKEPRKGLKGTAKERARGFVEPRLHEGLWTHHGLKKKAISQHAIDAIWLGVLEGWDFPS